VQIFGATETKRGAERERKTRKTGNRGTYKEAYIRRQI